jgi:heme-degrading monooxygenase HmoA
MILTNLNRKADKMAVKVVIRRIVPENRVEDLRPLLRQLRTLATVQHGYISGETLRRLDKPDEFLVISTWESAQDWNRWARSQERNQVQGKIDTILGGKTEYGIFHYGFSEKTKKS